MHETPYVHIKVKKGLQLIDFHELSQYRDLLYVLVARDIKVKYKQTILGFLWAVIRPLFMMMIFTIFLGRLAKIPSDGVPYAIFNYTAMVIWTYFSTAIASSGNSIIGSSHLISKVYFPRILIPITPVVAGLLDFIIAFGVGIGMLLYYQIQPTIFIVFLPILIMLMVITATGTGLLLSALNARYRDIQYLTPFLTQFWMFASPIVYPTSLVPEKWKFVYSLNPMTGIIEGFRSVLLDTVDFPIVMIITSGIVSTILLIIGLIYFNQTRKHLADVI